MKYCANCGNELEERKTNIEWYCAHCKRRLYANPIPSIDAVLFDGSGRILVGRRNVEPNKGKLNLPGGFVDPNETFEQAISRELKEELDLNPSDYGKLAYAGSRVDRHVQDANERQLLSVIMIADMEHRDFAANEEVSEYLWKLPAELTPQEMTTQSEYDHVMAAVERHRDT
jgi:NAD+ diphosphatase